jgi:hypothetical protein
MVACPSFAKPECGQQSCPTPAVKLSLEQSLDFIEPDELVEVTPSPSACASATSRRTSGHG